MTIIKDEKPQHGVLMLQPRCNMTCSFCVTEDSMGTMSYELAQKLLQNLKAQGFISAIFGGGEPFYWPNDLKKILMFAKDLGLTTQVGTNATRLPADFTQWNFVDRWVIPVDGVTHEVHNQLRTFQNRHLQIALETLEKLKKARRSTTISTVITKVNHHEVIAIGEYLRKLQNSDHNFIHAWHLYKFLPFGRGGKVHKAELEITDDKYEKIVSAVRGLDLPFKIFKRKDMLLSKTVEFYWVENGKLMAQSRDAGQHEVIFSSFEKVLL